MPCDHCSLSSRTAVQIWIISYKLHKSTCVILYESPNNNNNNNNSNNNNNNNNNKNNDNNNDLLTDPLNGPSLLNYL